MSEPKYRDWILETIDSLRSRKARPDLERICRMVRRRYGSDPDRTRSELEKLIQEQTVLKVCYKGSISYRNAAKVQRKSRKKPEQATGSGETVGEQAKHANFNNSAHSPTDTKETVCLAELTEANHYHDLQLKTSAIPKQNDEAVLVPTSGNSCLSCGAAVCQSRARCTAGSGVVKASAPKDKKPPQTGGSGTSVGRDKGNNNSNNNATDASNKIRGARGVQMGLSRHERSSNKGKKTCTLAKASSSHLLRHKQQASLKSKLRVGTKGGSRNGADPNNLDVGDRLVASVRTLAEKSRGVNAATGHTPRGLKEISGFVSSQERLSQEKLTRSKVKVVLEREVVKGRLRKTRFGNVTLPNRGVGPAKRSARLLTSALQSRHTVKKVMDVKPMNIRRREQKDDNVRVKNSQHQGDSGTPSQVEVDTGTPLVQPSQLPCFDAAASLMNPTVDADTKSVSPVLPVMSLPPSSLSSSPSSPPSCATLKHEGSDHEPCVTNGCPVEGMSKELKTETAGDPEEGDSLKLECVPEGTEEMGEGTAICIQVASDLQGVVKMEGDTITSSVCVQTCSGYKMETGEVSCLLTPTASPQDGDVVEERGLNGDVLVKVEKSSQNPVEWTVADVASYFTAAGFPEQAAAFRMQEIDGKSLLLMQRNDVLTGLSIRLGPALKIYERHVKVLQQTHFQDDGALC